MISDVENNRDILPGGPMGFLARRWMIILVPLILLPVISYFASVGKPPVFGSTARLLVEKSNLSSPLLDSFSLKLDLAAQLRTLEKTAMRPILLDQVWTTLTEKHPDLNTSDIKYLSEVLEIHVADDG